MNNSKYFLDMIKYYLTVLVFNISMITLLSLCAYAIGSWTFLFCGAILINSIRWYIDDAYHCKKLINCIILTNIIFLICGIIVESSIIPLNLTCIAFCFFMLLLYRLYPSRQTWIILCISIVAFWVGGKEIKDSIVLSIITVLLLGKRESEING